MAQKRSRSENFTREEKDLLVQLIIKHKGVIENKKTDAVSQKAKENAFRMITVEFNSQSTRARSTSSLKICWENIKKKSRKVLAAEKQNIFNTGGEFLSYTDDPILCKVKDILSLSSDGLANPVSNSLSSTKRRAMDPIADSSLEAITDQNLNKTPSMTKSNEPNNSCGPHRRPHMNAKINAEDLVNLKIELSQIAKENAIAEEARKMELHALQVEREKLSNELLSLQIINEKKKAALLDLKLMDA